MPSTPVPASWAARRRYAPGGRWTTGTAEKTASAHFGFKTISTSGPQGSNSLSASGLSRISGKKYLGEPTRFVSRDPFMKTPVRLINSVDAGGPIQESRFSIDGLNKSIYSPRTAGKPFGPRAFDGYQNGMSRYGGHFLPNMLDPSGMISVEICQRPVQVPGGGLGAALFPFAQHWFLKVTFSGDDLKSCQPCLTGKTIVKEVGLGAVGGGADPNAGQIGDYTAPVDHSGQSALSGVTCTPMTGQFDACKLWKTMTDFTPTGKKCGPGYNCHDWVLDGVSGGRQPGTGGGPAPGYPWPGERPVQYDPYGLPIP